jgi:general secretion pathway protein M
MATVNASQMSDRFAGVVQPARDYWNARAPRERTILAALGLLVLLALLYLLLIEPALSGRAQLRKSLPGLRSQVSQVQGMSRELSSARPAGEAAAQPATRENIEASLTRAGLKAQSVTVSGELVRVQLNAVSFAGLTAWLEQVGKSLGISVTEASIVAQAQADTVNATLTLRQQR